MIDVTRGARLCQLGTVAQLVDDKVRVPEPTVAPATKFMEYEVLPAGIMTVLPPVTDTTADGVTVKVTAADGAGDRRNTSTPGPEGRNAMLRDRGSKRPR